MTGSVRRSLVLSFAQKYTTLLISVPSIMLLARFLTPAETGIFTVALSLTNIAHMLRDFGVADYLIQERALDRHKLRSAFTVAWITGWLMALVIFVCAPAAAHFYRQPGVENVLGVVALNFVLIPLGSPASSMMRRELAYGALYVRNTAETLARASTSVSLAIAGFGYMSLAWGSLTGIAVGTMVAAILRPRYVFLMPSLRHGRAVFSFGQKMIVIDILRQLAMNGNSIVTGRTLGFAATGLLSRGAGLINMFRSNFQEAISSVAYPTFAQRGREGRDVKKLFTKSIAYVTAVSWPFYVFAAIMAHPIILAAYGSQWIAAVQVLRLIAVAAAISSLNLYTGQLQMATGHINSYFWSQTILQPLRLALIVVAAFYSIEAVASVQIVMAIAGICVQYRQLRKHLDLHLMTVLRGTYTSATIAALSSIGPAAVLALDWIGKLKNPWIELVAAGVGAGMGWLIGVYACKHPLAGEIAGAWTRVYRRLYLRHSEG